MNYKYYFLFSDSETFELEANINVDENKFIKDIQLLNFYGLKQSINEFVKLINGMGGITALELLKQHINTFTLVFEKVEYYNLLISFYYDGSENIIKYFLEFDKEQKKCSCYNYEWISNIDDRTLIYGKLFFEIIKDKLPKMENNDINEIAEKLFLSIDNKFILTTNYKLENVKN